MTKPIISFIVLLLSIGFSFFYVVPAYNLSQTRRGDIETLAKTLSTSSEIKTLIEKTKRSLGSIDPSALARFEVFLPATIDPVRFANNIQAIGIKNRIILSDIKVEAPGSGVRSKSATGTSPAQGVANTLSLGAQINKAEAPIPTAPNVSPGAPSDKKYETTKASFSFGTTYETFQLFLNDLQTSLGVINITSLSFTQLPEPANATKSKTPPPPMYQFMMTIETYSLK